MKDACGQSPLPTGFELVESVLLSFSAIAVGAFALPGLTLCVPGIAFVAMVVLAPVVAVTALAAVVGTIVAVPYLLVRSIRAIRARRAAAPAAGRSPSLAQG